MALREKKCKFCGKYFHYEDGVDTHGVALTREDSRVKAGNKNRITGFCPLCVDPHRTPHMSYRKTTIISVIRKHMIKKGIEGQFLDDDTIIGMLDEFPSAYKLYHGNGSYKTFNLLAGTLIDGRYGKFLLGEVDPKAPVQSKSKKPQLGFLRQVVCYRCKTIRLYDKLSVLKFAMGLKMKCCSSCDSMRLNRGSPIQKNTVGLNRKGSRKSEFSCRSMARALNVSKNDYVRHRITKPEPPLPIGTKIGKFLRVESSFWDEKTCAPRYILVCDYCGDDFVVLQKRAHLLDHYCQKVN